MAEDDAVTERAGRFSICVVDKDGQPLPNLKVFCHYENDVANEMEHTDKDGRPVFPIYGSANGGNHVLMTSIVVDDEEVSRERWHPTNDDSKSFTIKGRLNS